MRQIDVSDRLDASVVAEVVALAATVEAAAGHAPLGELSTLRLRKGGGDGFAAVVLRDAPGGDLVGYAQVTPGAGGIAVELAVHPGVGEDTHAVRLALLGRALGEVASGGGGRVQVFVPQATERDDDLARATGLAPARDLLQLRRALPLEVHLDAAADKVATRPFRPGEDEAAWLAVNNAAFADHPEQGAWDAAALADREAEAWFDPAGLLLAERDGRLVGFCWTKVAAGAHGLGEIYVVAVSPDHQGAGLGRSLVAAGCRSMAGRGVRTAGLYVDGDNAPALRLYRDLGFAVDHRDRVYAGTVTAGAR